MRNRKKFSICDLRFAIRQAQAPQSQIENRNSKIQNRPSARRGTISTEYLLVLALVVIPLAAMLPLFISMIQQYAGRITSLMRLPFP